MSEVTPLSRAYGVHLLYERAPELGKATLLGPLRQRCGAVAAIDPVEGSPGLSFHFPAHRVPFKGQSLPVQCWMLVIDKPLLPETVEASLAQTWFWPGARAAVARHRAIVSVTDLLAGTLDYKERLDLFQNALQAVLSVAPPAAIHWARSGKFVEPAAYLRSHEAGPGYAPLYGPVNVRSFDEKGGTLMDTLGLSALGLPDFEVRFSGYERGAVAALLYDAAAYLYEHGPVIAAGHTIRGLREGERWTCELRRSIAEPDRPVVHLEPGGARA